MKRLLSICLSLIVLVGLSGCETFKGLGRDVQKAGQVIEDAASR